MVSKLPAKRESQGLIGGHKRRLPSGRVIDVNKGIPSRAKQKSRRRKGSQNWQRGGTRRKPQKSIIPIRSRKLTIKKRKQWQKVFDPFDDKKKKEIEYNKFVVEARKYGITRDPRGVWLLPGEKSYRKFKGLAGNPMSVMKDAIFEDFNGQEIVIPAVEARMSNASLWDWLYKTGRDSEPVIIGLEEDMFFGNRINSAREYKDVPVEELIEFVKAEIAAEESGDNRYGLFDGKTGEELFGHNERQARLDRWRKTSRRNANRKA
jgi:hypothetical protein